MTCPVVPIVHLNGTSRAELLRVRLDAAHAVERAREAIQAMAPNGRDYYPEPGRMDKALAQHERRLDTLNTLYTELLEEYLSLEE